MSTEAYEKINAKDKPIAEDFVYVYSEIEDGGFRKVSKAMLKALLGVATKLSELENDKEFITKTVLDLENYYLKSDTYSKDEIDNRISLIPRFNVQVVSSLPTTDISETTVYLVSSGDDSDNLYTEYINVNGLWEILGTQKIASVENAVLYTAQSLTDEQKAQARTNISAASAEEVGQLRQQIDDYSSHKSNESIHVTSAEKQVWNNKADASQLPTIVQEAGESETSVMSQKAVTKLVNDALGTEESEFETVDSIEEMTDKTKQYILSTTGTVWTYGEVTVEVKPQNKFVPSTATLNQRLSSSSGSVSANDTSIGSFITDFIPISNMDSITPFNVRLNWEYVHHSDNKVLFYDSSKTRLSGNVITDNHQNVPGSNANATIANGEFFVDIKTPYNASTTLPNWADVGYVRFQLFVKASGTELTSADIADLTITFDHEGGTKTENTWYDTGMIPEDAKTSYVDLLVKVNQNKTDISEVSKRVTSLETGSDTLTIPSFWQSAVDECIAKIKALQVGRNCITFPFFSDNHQRNGYAGILIAYIMKECNIPYAFFGGDSIDSGYIASEAIMIEQDRLFDTAMSYIPNGRFCRAVGNHDGYWAVDVSNKNYYTDAQNYELFLREESIAQNKHFGGDGTYYYVEDISSKVRFIVLDTNDGTVEDEQLTWLQNVALSFNESGWGVVFISHQPISNHYHALIGNADAIRTIVKNYINGSATNKADIIGWFSGHIHRDRIYTGIATNTTDDTEGEAMGFTQVTITSDHTSIAYDDATKHTVASDNQSHAIDFVTINKSTRTVNLTRLGIGSDRSYTY